MNGQKARQLFPILFLIAGAAFASGDDIDLEANQTLNAGDVLGGDVSHDSTAWGFSHSLGDVDINEGENCMGSEAWGSIIVSRQTNELNQWCAGLFYDLNGKHAFAAKMRCDIPVVRQHFDSDEACWAENTLVGIDLPPEAAAVIETQQQYIEQHEDEEEQHELLIADALRRSDELEARLDRESANRRAYASRQAKAEKAKADDEYEFQQQMLEQFVQIVEPPTGNE